MLVERVLKGQGVSKTIETEVVVVGTGAGGSAVAGRLARAGRTVLMVESGPHAGQPFGNHVRNSDASEAGIAQFGSLLQQALVFPSESKVASPALADLKVIHGVGGMLSYWTCNCPTPHPMEQSPWIGNEDWERVLADAKDLLFVSYALGEGSLRQARIIERVESAIGPRAPGRGVQAMPVAARRVDGFVRFSSIGELLDAGANSKPVVRADTICTRVLHSAGHASGVLARPRHGGGEIEIRSEAVVVACGTAGTPKLLASSGVDAGPALGRYVFDHPSVGSRVVLKKEILADISPDDPVFTVWIPYAPDHPWHNQICRFPSNPTAIEYRAGPLDTADLFLFSAMEVRPENRFRFDLERLDPYGLPELIGEYALSDGDMARISEGLAEQFRIAAAIGDLVHHRWSPQFYGPGWSMHMMGSCRMGGRADDTSCVDSCGRLWGYDNLYVSGNAVFAVPNAGNPTLMTVALGLWTADDLLKKL
jgi:choline dehydrogenase-like flavoprotein